MMRAGLVAAVLWAGTLLPAVVLGEEAPTTPGPTQDTAPLDLSVRARALGLVPEPHATGGTLDLEPLQAPTGAGVTRLPRPASGRERGGFIGVVVCDPDGVERLYLVRIDDAGSLPEGNLRGTPGPRGLFLPGRP